MVNQEEKFREILTELSELYHKKNHDYGDSFRKSLQEFGTVAAVVRMSDKMERLKTLTKWDKEVTSESFRDTVIDLANYAIMLAMEL